MGTVVRMADFKAKRSTQLRALAVEAGQIELKLQELRYQVSILASVRDREAAAIAMIPLQEKLYSLRQQLKRYD